MDFLLKHSYASGWNKDNNLTAAISGLACITLQQEDQDVNQKKMLGELLAMAALHFAIMSPCLLVSSVVVVVVQ